jgi:hypothetical protein
MKVILHRNTPVLSATLWLYQLKGTGLIEWRRSNLEPRESVKDASCDPTRRAYRNDLQDFMGVVGITRPEEFRRGTFLPV